MSYIKEIEVRREFVINLGNYESAKFGTAMTIVLDENDDPDSAHDDLVDIVDMKIQEDMAAFDTEGKT
jgi:hypothetical protein